MKRIATMILVLAVLGAFATTAAAQAPVEYNVTVKANVVKGSPNDHYVTFTAPVEIPDATLAPGTYVFSVIAPSIIQVTNSDRTLHFAMFFTAPAQRGGAANDAYQMAFAESNAGSPSRITKWYLPNRAVGYEFLYPATEVSGAR